MDVFKFLILTLFFSTLTVAADGTCAESPSLIEDSAPKILGGVQAKAEDWPWMAALVFADIPDLYSAQYCSGVLIDDYWILTAAHCVYNLSANDVEDAVGAFDLSNFPGSRIAVKNIHIHPRYSTVTWHNDIALLELIQPSSTPKIPLFTGESYEDIPPSLLGKVLTAIGWGLADGTATWYYPERLRQVELPVVADSYCNNSYASPYSPLSGSQLCAGRFTGKDTCAGDSGGPVVTQIDGNWVHVGLTSYGAPCQNYYGWYGVYTRTSAFFEFIRQYVPNADFWTSRKSLPWLILLLGDSPPS